MEKETKQCNFCDVTLPNLHKDYTFYISRGSNMMINIGTSTYVNYDIWIKFCPMCGRKLRTDE